MMKIQVASDLHFEFPDNRSYLDRFPLKPVGDILVLAGDIGYLNDDNFTSLPFWDWASDHYSEVIVAVGNHELYQGYDLAKIPQGIVCSIRNNVKCYYNAVVQFGSIELIVSTLWSKIRTANAWLTERCITDFQRILYNGAPLAWVRFNREHEKCFSFIKDTVEKSVAEHIVVVTHHVPSFQLESRDYVGSPVAGAFTVELAKYIETSPIECWIYGHSHRNIDKTIGKTRCVTNQLGYVSHNEHFGFLADKVIEIGG